MHGRLCLEQDAAARLARGAATLAARLEREQRYYRGAVQLQREWKLRASPPGQQALSLHYVSRLLSALQRFAAPCMHGCAEGC